MSCLHCGRDETSSERGLCRVCAGTPAIRCRYRRLATSASNGWIADNHERPLPEQPTDAPAGSAEKIAVLAQRAASGVGLWHPRDARFVVT